MKALIVDGEEIYRLSMKEVISKAANFSEIIEAGSEHEFLSMTARHDLFDLIILQPASLQGDGENCLRLVQRLYPGTKLICIGKHSEYNPSHMGHNYTVMPRTASIQDMVAAIRRALKLPVDSYYNADRTHKFGQSTSNGSSHSEFSKFKSQITAEESGAKKPVDLSRLSYRQKQILAMAADGLPNKEIAARLSIAEGTVKAHMHSIFKVLGVSNRTQAVIRYGASGGSAAMNVRSSAASWQQATAV